MRGKENEIMAFLGQLFMSSKLDQQNFSMCSLDRQAFTFTAHLKFTDKYRLRGLFTHTFHKAFTDVYIMGLFVWCKLITQKKKKKKKKNK